MMLIILIRVMRMEAGDRLSSAMDVKRGRKLVISSVTAGKVEAELGGCPWTAEPVWSVTVAQSLPKGDKMELVIQKGTEIGAPAFLPFQSERMIVQYDGKKEAKRLERWGKIAKEAAEQAHRSDHSGTSKPSLRGSSCLRVISAFDLALVLL